MPKVKLQLKNEHFDKHMKRLEDAWTTTMVDAIRQFIPDVVKWYKEKVEAAGAKLNKAIDWDDYENPDTTWSVEDPWYMPSYTDFDDLDRLFGVKVGGIQIKAAGDHVKAVYSLSQAKTAGKVNDRMSFTAAMKVATRRQFTEEDQAAVEWLTTYQLNEIKGQDDDALRVIKRHLLDAAFNRESPNYISTRIKRELGTWETDFRRIAITETARAYSDAALNQMTEMGDDLCFVSAAGEGFHVLPGGRRKVIEPCIYCQEKLENRVFRINDLRGASNFGKKPASWEAAIPMHPNCRHHPQPATKWVIEQIKGKKIPKGGVKIDYVPPADR